jgi:hypothetical protein
MQIAKRWQLDPHHVLQRNPLALTADEEQWLRQRTSAGVFMTGVRYKIQAGLAGDQLQHVRRHTAKL